MKNEKTSEEIFREQRFAEIRPTIINTNMIETNYEVDNLFYEKFVSKSRINKIYFKNKNKTKKLFNLRKFVTDELLKLNVIVDQVNKDTFTERSNFYSYRRSRKLKQKDYGRCVSTVCLL